MQGMSARWLLSALALVAGLAVITVTLAGLLRSHFTDCTDGNKRSSSACDRSSNRFGLLRLGLETLGVSSKSSRNLPLFDMNALFKEEDDFKCIETATNPSTPLCIFLAQEDQFVSAQLASEGIWEPHIIQLYQQALRNFPQALIFDFGAHIGFYTLLAAAMGHRVIAVEPATDSCRRLVCGVRRANVSNLVTLVGAAVADVSYVPLVLDPKPGNKGGTRVHPAGKLTDKTPLVNVITMDDLIELQPHGGVAIIKMDIEGYECKAFATSKNFFRTFKIPYVFMEWGVMFRDRHRYFSPCRPVDMRATSDALVALKYSAISTRNGIVLDPEESATNWQVSDIMWRHAEAPQLSTYN